MEDRRLARLSSCAIYIAISSIFAAFHGSWNRKKHTGYKIARIPFDHSTGKPRGEYEDFVTGFVTSDGNVWGRPVGITVAKDGSLFFSEDGNGTLWRASFRRWLVLKRSR
jgi:glucose/arabinose dehydrogenase